MVGLRPPHAITVHALRICTSMTKLKWTWLFPCHRNLPRNSAVRNALPRPQRRCRHPLHHRRLRSRREENAKGQLLRQVEFLTGGSTVLALQVPL